MFRTLTLFILITAFGCVSAPSHQEERIGFHAWKVMPSTMKKYHTMYIVGICEVHVSKDQKSVIFRTKNRHWPLGIYQHIVTAIKSDSGKFEVLHNYNTAYDLNRDKTYPEYEFFYDAFYAQCYLAAEELPDPVSEFLRAYDIAPYNENHEMEKKKKSQII